VYYQKKNLPSAGEAEKAGVLHYLRANSSRMRYDQYLKAGHMIGSGAIESAHFRPE